MSLQKLRQQTYTFNHLAGKDLLTTQEDFAKDFDILLSEVQELQAGIEANDIKEIVDGVIDTVVVAFGVWQKLENLGVNMDKAANRISDNNLSKLPITQKTDTSIEKNTIHAYGLKGIQVEVISHDLISYQRLVFKNKETGKVLKPFGFKSVDIDDCIPFDLLWVGLNEKHEQKASNAKG